MSLRPIKCVLVGDGAVGKACFLDVVCKGTFPDTYVPMIMEVFSHTFKLSDERTVDIEFWYTAGQEDYDRLRPLSYPDSDVFLVCFSVDRHNSLQNVIEKWHPEVRHFLPKSPLLLVGMKSDLSPQVEQSEAIQVAKKIGAVGYYECSAMKHRGIDAVVKSLVRVAISRRTSVWPWKRQTPNNFEVSIFAPLPPQLPKAPPVTIPSSKFQSEWCRMINSDQFSDVQFHFKSGHCYYAHKVMLCAASELFRRVFEVGAYLESVETSTECDGWSKETLRAITRQSVKNGAVSAFKDIYDKENYTVIVINDEQMTRLAFEKCLNFLYTGCTGVVKDYDFIVAAELLNLPELLMIFQMNEVTYPTVRPIINKRQSEVMEQLFLNKSLYSDVTFVVEGKRILAHRLIVTAHCEVMSAMFSGQFYESTITEVEILGTDVDTFLIFLQYLYTSSAPMEKGDPMALLELSDRYCMDRLKAICEQNISEIVGRFAEDNIADCDVNFIELLLHAQRCNANQLSGFLLHFISSNYLAFESTEQFKSLTGDNLLFVQEHRWPPLSYFKALEEWKEKDGKESMPSATSKNCILM